MRKTLKNSGEVPGIEKVRGVPRDVEYDAYEKLPPRVRERVKYATVPISCYTLLTWAETEQEMMDWIAEGEEEVQEAIIRLISPPASSSPWS